MKKSVRSIFDRLFELFPRGFPWGTRKPWFAGLAGILGFAFGAMVLSGCNIFDGVDTSFKARTDQDIVEEGDIALESGDFTLADELFSRLYSRGVNTASVVRGKGEAMAGSAGFTVLEMLDAIQNGSGPYDKAPILFRTAFLIRDRPGLEAAVGFMMRIPQPDHPDRISRGLMKIAASVRRLLEKYDTNRNRKLDPYDEIDFDTNDKTTPSWPDLYRMLVTGPTSDDSSLEQAFLDLAYGFDGRGEPWIFISPYAGRRIEGNYTPSHRRTILALGDLVERLETANPHFDLNPTTFAESVRNLDGTD